MPRIVRRWSPPRPKRDYLASFSSALIISTLWHSCRNACIYIYTYIFLSLFSPYPSSRVPYRASSSLLYSFTVSRPVRPPLFSALLSLSIHSCAIRGGLFARAFHSRSLVLSLSFVGRNTLLSVLRRVGRSLASSLARSRSFHPAPRPAHPPDARFGLRFLRALRLFLQPPASVLCSGYAQRARRAGARNTRCGHVDSLRSLARLASPRFASLRLWRFFVERGVERPVLLLFLLVAGRCRGVVVNCAGRGRPRAHVPDVIFRLVKSRNNRASGACVRACVRMHTSARARVRARGSYEFACGSAIAVLRIHSE